jgi:uncharacterized protein with HEPN domain
MSHHLHILVELRKLIVEEADNEAKYIIDGLAPKDFHTYKEHVGRLYAYRRALELFGEAAEKVEKST